MIPNGPIRYLWFVASLALVSSFAFAGPKPKSAAEPTDWHLSSSGAKAFFTRSSLAHGYMHGYEEGFHQGDLDLQLGRQFQAYKDLDGFKKIRGYRRNFGDHKNFQEGYRKGYAVGYIDAYAGRDFRAMQLVEQAKTERDTAPLTLPDRHFDEVFLQGYELGQRAGLADGRVATAVAALDPKDCGQTVPVNDANYCDAYHRGYRLGYSDGFANQREGAPVFAKK